MCGLFGYSGSKFPDPADICLGIWDAEERGSHSTGVYGAFLWKKALPANKFIEEERPTINKACMANNVIAHTRHATMGAKTTELAHPFRVGELIGTHNGWVPELKWQLATLEQKMPEVDSHMIYRTLKKKGYNLSALELVEGSMALAWIYNDHLYLYRRESKPLFIGYKSKKQLFYSSREKGLKLVGCKDISEIEENLVYRIKDGEVVEIIQLADPKISIPKDCLPSFFRTKSKGDHIIPRNYDVVEDEITKKYRFMTEEEKEAKRKADASRTYNRSSNYSAGRYNAKDYRDKGPYTRLLCEMAKVNPTPQQKEAARASLTLRLVDFDSNDHPLEGFVVFTKYSPVVYPNSPLYSQGGADKNPIEESIKAGFVTNVNGLIFMAIDSFNIADSKVTFYFSPYGLKDVIWQYTMDVKEDDYNYKSISIDLEETCKKNKDFAAKIEEARKKFHDKKEFSYTPAIKPTANSIPRMDTQVPVIHEKKVDPALTMESNKHTSRLFTKEGMYDGHENLSIILESTAYTYAHPEKGKLWGGNWYQGKRWNELRATSKVFSDMEAVGLEDCDYWINLASAEAGIPKDNEFKTTRIWELICEEFEDGSLPYTTTIKAMRKHYQRWVEVKYGDDEDDDDKDTPDDKFASSEYDNLNEILGELAEVKEFVDACDNGKIPQTDTIDNCKISIEKIKKLAFQYAGIDEYQYRKLISK